MRSAIVAACSLGSASASSKLFVWSDWAPPQTAESACTATRTMLFSGCWAVSVEPPVWAWKRSACAFAVVAPKRSRMICAHRRAGRPELRDLLEEVVVRVEEEREPGAERIGREPRRDGRLAVGDPVRERERELLRGRRARLADVVAGDRDRVPARDPLLAVGEQIRRQPHRRPRREDVVPARHVLLEDVVLHRAAQRRAGHALLLGDQFVEQEQQRRRGVDRHRRRDLVERDPVQQHLHVGDRVDRDARAPHLALGHRDRPSRSRAGSAGRTRSRAPSGRARAGSGSARSTPPPTRSRRTGGSSTAGRGTCPGTAPA